jgi:hypothetical protein
MTRGAPEHLRAAVAQLAETFRAGDGAWVYVEIDAGFPWANVEALIESTGRWRG